MSNKYSGMEESEGEEGGGGGEAGAGDGAKNKDTWREKIEENRKDYRYPLHLEHCTHKMELFLRFMCT